MQTTDSRVHQFIDALQQAERSRDATPLLQFFSDDVQISSISLHKPMTGSEGAKKFWTDYLAIFRRVASEFVYVHASGDLAVLEWKSQGVLPDGNAIQYLGVSILEFTGEKICRFRTYYDSALFMPDGAKLLGRVMA